MTKSPISTLRAGAVRAGAAAAFLVIAAQAGAQGAGGSGNGAPVEAATPPGREESATTAVGSTDTAGRKQPVATHAAQKNPAVVPKRDGELGRAPFGTGSRKPNPAEAGAPSPKPSSDAEGATGTR